MDRLESVLFFLNTPLKPFFTGSTDPARTVLPTALQQVHKFNIKL